MRFLLGVIGFFKTLTLLAQACFVLWLIALAMAIYSWLPLEDHSQFLVLPMLLATMVAMVSGFLTLDKLIGLAWRAGASKKVARIKVSFPRTFWVAAGLSTTYAVAVCGQNFLLNPTGVDLGPGVQNLRIASSAVLLLCPFTLGLAQWAGIQIRSFAAEV